MSLYIDFTKKFHCRNRLPNGYIEDMFLKLPHDLFPIPININYSNGSTDMLPSRYTHLEVVFEMCKMFVFEDIIIFGGKVFSTCDERFTNYVQYVFAGGQCVIDTIEVPPAFFGNKFNGDYITDEYSQYLRLSSEHIMLLVCLVKSSVPNTTQGYFLVENGRLIDAGPLFPTDEDRFKRGKMYINYVTEVMQIS